jgi:ribosomal-protein-alanine N-acetyltransferase
MFEYSGWNPYATMEMAEDTVREFIVSYERPDFYGWAICLRESDPEAEPSESNKEGCRLIGTIGAYDYDDKAGRIEVGASIERASWGKGYASEALEAVLHYLTEREGIREVTAWCADDNIGSIKIMKKAGMEQVGVEKDALEITGKRYDKLIFSFT